LNTTTKLSRNIRRSGILAATGSFKVAESRQECRSYGGDVEIARMEMGNGGTDLW